MREVICLRHFLHAMTTRSDRNKEYRMYPKPKGGTDTEEKTGDKEIASQVG